MYKNIIWDFDGTLFNTYPAITASFNSTLDDIGK
jgi:phosphoglycolate phosphatase-like HAD superfamily hydrolase